MDLIGKALNFAAEKHEGQKRKITGTPYILHPMEVAAIVGTMTNDPEIIAGALLHDTVEDTGATPEELEERFGRRVADYVRAESENKRSDLPAGDTWMIRKQETIDALAACTDRGVKIICLADKLANMRSFAREYRRSGSGFWEHGFHQKDPAKQAWYYRSIAACLQELSDTDAYREYTELTALVFEGC